jgi:hypothetical protein
MEVRAVGIEGRVPAAEARFGRVRTRRITPEAGRALELLSHAIEYLTDEYLCETAKPVTSDGQIAAIQLLMSLNRQVYFECPIVTTFWDRIRARFLP